MTTEVRDPVDAACFNPKEHGKHEALHLFLSRLTSLAHSRYVLEREIDHADESMVRVLERLL